MQDILPHLHCPLSHIFLVIILQGICLCAATGAMAVEDL